jgi:hypothetical protein
VRTLLVIAVLLTAAALRAALIGGPGYALDEEITVFAVRGIQETGLPLFPSGVLSDRGLPFSYAAWAAGLIFGQELQSYRLVSLVSALTTILVLYVVMRRLAGDVAAVSAAVLLAIFPVHIAVSGWARFYAAAVAAFTASIALFLAAAEATDDRRAQYGRWFIASVVISVLLHELCIVLVALPLLAMIVSRDHDRKQADYWTRTFIWCVAAVAAARLMLVVLHFVAPNQSLNPWLHQGASVTAPSRLLAPFTPVSASAGVLTVLGVLAAVAYAALVRYRKSPRLMLALCMLAALLFQLGMLAVATLIASLLRPARATLYLRMAAVAALASAVYWTVHTWWTTSAALTVELFRSLTLFSVSYPFLAVLAFVQSLPLTSLALAAAVVLTFRASPGERERQLRVLAAVILLSLSVLSVLNLGDTARYYLVSWPIVLILAGYVIGVLWQTSRSSNRYGRLLGPAAALALTLGLVFEHRAFSRTNPVLMTGGNPPLGTIERIDPQRWSARLSAIPHDAVVISNDELASMYHLGRIDYWLATSDWDLARYELVTDTGRYGEYAGARVISTVDDLWKAMHRGDGRPSSVVLFRTGRFEYHLPRQLALELSRRDPRAMVDEDSGLLVVTLHKSD